MQGVAMSSLRTKKGKAYTSSNSGSGHSKTALSLSDTDAQSSFLRRSGFGCICETVLGQVSDVSETPVSDALIVHCRGRASAFRICPSACPGRSVYRAKLDCGGMAGGRGRTDRGYSVCRYPSDRPLY